MARSAVRTASSEVLLGLGSNQGDRSDHLLRALASLQEKGLAWSAISSCYETRPVGGPPQPDFLNLAARGIWPGSALHLLHLCQGIEAGMGRTRTVRYGPRSIDIDILLLGQRVIVRDRLQVPHPEISDRAFVLVPACEVAGDWIHPVLERSLQSLLESLPPGQCVVKRAWLPAESFRLRSFVP